MKPKTTTWRPFSEARAFVHQLGLKSKDKWKEYSKSGERPPDIPPDPEYIYKSEFKGFGDWLGTGTIATSSRSYRPFAEARAFVHTLGLKNYHEWRAYCKSGKKPPDIPSDPRRAYRSEYKGIEDWLGAKYLPFIEARAFVHTLHLKNSDEWEAYRKSGGKPINIPSNPNKVYSAEYKGLRDWLGVVDKWDSRTLLARLYELRPQVQTLEMRELYGLLEQEGSFSAFRRTLGQRVTPAQVLRELKDNNGSRLEQALRDTLNDEAEAPVGFTVEEASANNSVRAVDVFEQENDGAVGSEMQITNPDKALTTEAHLTASFLHSQGDRAEGSIPQQEEERVTEVVRSTGTIEVFFCYAHKDQPLLNQLKAHLISLQRKGLITMWADTDIDAGREWEKEIEKHLDTAEIILLLVSPDFMNSDYCYGIEMKRAIEGHERGEVTVIPVIVRPVYWQEAPFGKLQPLPTGGKPVTDPDWHNLDRAFFNITEGIHKVVEKLAAKSSIDRSMTSTQALSSAKLKGKYYLPGEKVLHDKFGEGVVVDSELEGNSELVTVQFKVGRKRLNMDFTSLEKL